MLTEEINFSDPDYQNLMSQAYRFTPRLTTDGLRAPENLGQISPEERQVLNSKIAIGLKVLRKTRNQNPEDNLRYVELKQLAVFCNLGLALYQPGSFSYEDKQDLIQDKILGLCRAAEDVDCDKGTYSTRAGDKIRQQKRDRIYEVIKRNCFVPIIFTA